MAAFPGAGRKYRVDFDSFTVELSFASDTSLTYTVKNPDGSDGQTETVTIRAEEIGPDLFLVTWQEADKTTVVHVEDYAKKTIITSFTNPDLSFEQHHGTFVALPPAGPQDAPTYVHDIRPLFRDMDVTCMLRRQVKLADQAWMSTPSNALRVFTALSNGDMPPDSPGRRNGSRCSRAGWTAAFTDTEMRFNSRVRGG